MSDTHPGAGSATFWEAYLREHRSPVNRWLHVAGTVLSWVVAAVAIITGRWWGILLAPVVGYLPAWLGHCLVEHNRPMTIRSPWQALCCDYRLTLLVLTGRTPSIGTAPDTPGARQCDT